MTSSTALEDRTVLRALNRSTERDPARPAVVDGEVELSYEALFQQGMNVAGGLAALGVARGEPVLVMLDNNIDYVRTWLGLAFLGAVQVPVNTAYRGGLLTHIVNDSGARVALVEESYVARLAEERDQLHQLQVIVVRGATDVAWDRVRIVDLREVAAGPAVAPVDCHVSDVLSYMYTSGTTGRSRGVVVPYGHAWGSGAPEFLGGVADGGRALVTLPLFHVAGQYCGVYNALISGGTAAICPRFSASSFWSDAARFGCEWSVILGTMGTFLLRQPPGEGDVRHPMRTMLMFPVIGEHNEFESRFNVRLCSAYGMTEIGSVLISPPGTAAPQSCGWVRDDFDHALVDEFDMPVPETDVGELVLRPRKPWTTLIGYQGDPTSTLHFTRNLWIHTGDLMRRGPDGRLIFVDRRKDMVRRRGENVSSFEVEAAAVRHRDVLESAVIGVRSAEQEEDVLAAVVLAPGSHVEPSELFRYLAEQLPYFMVPRYIRVVSELPKTPTGRVQKHLLRDMSIEGSWDAEAHGLRATRDGIVHLTS